MKQLKESSKPKQRDGVKSLCLYIPCQINHAKQAAQDTKDQAKDLQDRISDNMDSFEREKNQTKDLIQRVKEYLTGQIQVILQEPGTQVQVQFLI